VRPIGGYIHDNPIKFDIPTPQKSPAPNTSPTSLPRFYISPNRLIGGMPSGAKGFSGHAFGSRELAKYKIKLLPANGNIKIQIFLKT
jgi:hypothetical protein